MFLHLGLLRGLILSLVGSLSLFRWVTRIVFFLKAGAVVHVRVGTVGLMESGVGRLLRDLVFLPFRSIMRPPFTRTARAKV